MSRLNFNVVQIGSEIMTGRKRIAIDVTLVEEFAGEGLTQEQIAHSLGISPRTLDKRKADSAEFADAIKRGKARGIQFVANALMALIKDGNVPATIFYLKCRAGWRETDKPDTLSVSTGDKLIIEVERISADKKNG